MFKPSRSNIYLAVFTLITVVLWAGFEIYRAYNTSTITRQTAEAITPLDPSVDESVLNDLEKRGTAEVSP